MNMSKNLNAYIISAKVSIEVDVKNGRENAKDIASNRFSEKIRGDFSISDVSCKDKSVASLDTFVVTSKSFFDITAHDEQKAISILKSRCEEKGLILIEDSITIEDEEPGVDVI